MNLIKIGERNYMGPASWSELTDAQLLAVAQDVFASTPSPVKKWRVFCTLVPAPKRLLRRLTEGQIYDLLQTVEWLWAEPMDVCPVQSFRHEGLTYHLPTPDLQHVTLGEYALADSYFRKFMESPKDTANLDALVATLCRPAGANPLAEAREAYDQGTADTRQKAFKSLPLGLRVVVLQYWVSRMRYVTERYKVIFEKPKQDAATHTSEPKANNSLGWFAIVYDLAEGGPFGDFEKTFATPLHTVLLYLVKKHYDIKELERKNGRK